MFSSYVSLVNAIKQEDIYIVYFTQLPNKVHIIEKNSHETKFQDPTLGGTGITPNSDVHIPTMLV
jgi:hypothetical protein